MSPAAPHRPTPSITRARVDNCKSIAHCDVASAGSPCCFGLNAAGTSNFLNALRFARDTLVNDPAEAVAGRNGWEEASRY